MPVITAQAELPKSQPVDATRQQNTVVEPVAAEVPAVQEDGLSPKFAILARREKAHRVREQAIKAREDAMTAKDEEYATKYVPKERLIKDTMAVLSENNVSYEALTQAILNQPGPQDVAYQKLEAKYNELEARLTKQATTAEENQTKAYEQAVSQIRNEAKLLVDADTAYETIKETDNLEAVVELIKETHAADGTILSVAEAATLVEEYLIEEAMKMASLNKVKQKLTPQEVVEQKPQAQSQQLKTLTNAVSATTKPLSSKDRRERAIAAFRGQLK